MEIKILPPRFCEGYIPINSQPKSRPINTAAYSANKFVEFRNFEDRLLTKIDTTPK